MPKKFESIEESRAYYNAWYAANKEIASKKILARKKKSIIESSQFVWDYLKEHPCVDCGETDPIVLEFDHIRDKHQEINRMLKNNCCIASITKEIEKCQVRCANCHRRKTAIQFDWYKNIKK